jgi:NTP pyrophosphatase (non-canonical NTP hydrolase)
MTLEELTERIIAFRDERDWEQFHNPKDVAMSLVLEAGEVMEHFQWKSTTEMATHIEAHRNDIGDELVDTLYWILLLAHDLKVDLPAAFDRKMARNAAKYPVALARGSHVKYTELTK